MNHTDKPIANPVVVLREEFDDWAILFNPDTAAAVGINPVGVSIWKSMNGQKSLQDIFLEIKTGFSDVPESAREELSDFVGKLIEQGYAGYELKASDRKANSGETIK